MSDKDDLISDQITQLFSNSIATMDKKGRLTPVPTNSSNILSLASQPRWGVRTPIIGGVISTVFLMFASGGLYFESAIIKNCGGIDIITRHKTYGEARSTHRRIVRIMDHRKLFGTNKDTDAIYHDDAFLYSNKPKKLENLNPLEKEAKHRAIRLKRSMKKLIKKA